MKKVNKKSAKKQIIKRCQKINNLLINKKNNNLNKYHKTIFAQ